MKILLSFLLFIPIQANAFFGLAKALMTSNTGSGSAAFSATGGTVIDVGIYRVHFFYSTTTVKTFTVTAGSGVVHGIVQASGASGGGDRSSGAGGAGGLVEFSSHSLTVGSYSITVGEGKTYNYGTGQHGNQGVNSTFDGITALGGGYGGAYDSVACASGGCGGGGAANNGDGCAGTQGDSGGGTGYGNAGGGPTGAHNYGAAGGGAGGAGADGGYETSAGGAGRSSPIPGFPITFAKGGYSDFNDPLNAGAWVHVEGSGDGGHSGYCGLYNNCLNSAGGMVAIWYIR